VTDGALVVFAQRRERFRVARGELSQLCCFDRAPKRQSAEALMMVWAHAVSPLAAGWQVTTLALSVDF